MVESEPTSQEPTEESAPEVQDQAGHVDGEEEEFRPAQEVFHDPADLDFLMQHGGCSKETALARQSLFVKFDPLVTGRQSMFPNRPSDGGMHNSRPGNSTSDCLISLSIFALPH